MQSTATLPVIGWDLAKSVFQLHIVDVETGVWAAAGFKDTLLRWKMKLEVADGHEKEIQPRVQA